MAAWKGDIEVAIMVGWDSDEKTLVIVAGENLGRGLALIRSYARYGKGAGYGIAIRCSGYSISHAGLSLAEARKVGKKLAALRDWTREAVRTINSTYRDDKGAAAKTKQAEGA